MNRRNIALQGVARLASDRAAELNPHNPIMGRFETHVNAKEWVIKSPDGEVFRCRNLMNWLREHEDLLDGTVKNAFTGLCAIKRSMSGASKRNNRVWKGWTVIDWGD
ncbi:hypothetical protein ACE41H_21400 [Paenibacillus enshidis]|uniref:Uncharacterized protein n=1 Tax=Paenibacillus enshidis TaxID=1458439 RepID=A0ABV5B1N0_9BACL